MRLKYFYSETLVNSKLLAGETTGLPVALAQHSFDQTQVHQNLLAKKCDNKPLIPSG